MKAQLISVEGKYDQSMGAYDLFHVWDGERVNVIGSMYDQQARESDFDQITDENLKLAKDWIFANTEEGFAYNKYCYNRLGANTFIGCIVKLKRSRKAPNGVELRVTDFHESHYSSKFNNHVTEQVTVTDGTSSWTVSSGCIDSVVKGVKELPYWY